VTETQLVKSCIDYLTVTGHFVWRNNTGRRGNLRFGKKGSGDILGVMKDGRFLSVECKVGKNKPSIAQCFFAADVERRGGVAVVVWSVDELIEKLD
jgi:hypothetical protein